MLFTASLGGLASAAEEALPALAAKPAASQPRVLVVNFSIRVTGKTTNAVSVASMHRYLCEVTEGEQTRGCERLRATCTTVNEPKKP